MPRLMFTNPFATHDVSEFEGVLIPLDRAVRHHSVVSNAEKEKDSDSDSSSSTAVHTTPSAQGLTLESLRAEVEGDVAVGGSSTTYDRKSKIINKAIQDIGMGKYQWCLFGLCGCGWLADNLWLQSVALVLPSLSAEFGVDDNTVRYTTLSLFLGLCIGASFWGIASDIVGRRLAFNCTLGIAGVFGLAAGGAPSWYGACGLFACLGLGIGGNLPVDGALFLEFLPSANGGLLTLLSVWWPVGNLIASLVAWPLIVNYSDHWGWRYFILTMGALTFAMFIARFFFFHLFESPKFLLSRGRQAEAVAVVHGIAYHNGAHTWLTEDILNQIGGDPEVLGHSEKLAFMDIIKRNLSKFSSAQFKPLFKDRKLGITTCLLWFMWTTIGMGYPLFNAFLPQYLGGDSTPPNITYRNYAITSVVGVPGSIIACFTVDIKYIGRKGTMAFATVVTGIFVYVFTISSDPDFQLTFSSLEALFQNVFYGVMYAYTPEVFPAPNRGTGTGISSFLNRLAGLCAPIVAVNAGQANPAAPIYASGGLFFAAFIAMLLLPIETRGRQSL